VSTSPGRHIRVPVNTSLQVFQWRPFTIIRVLYTSTSYLEIGAVFVYSSYIFCHENSKNGRQTVLTSIVTSLMWCMQHNIVYNIVQPLLTPCSETHTWTRTYTCISVNMALSLVNIIVRVQSTLIDVAPSLLPVLAHGMTYWSMSSQHRLFSPSEND